MCLLKKIVRFSLLTIILLSFNKVYGQQEFRLALEYYNNREFDKAESVLETLLEKTRAISGLIQRAAGKPVNFDEMAKVLSSKIEANCYIVGRRGKILGYCFMEGFKCEEMDEIVLHTERFPESYNEGLLKITATEANSTQVENNCVFNKYCIKKG